MKNHRDLDKLNMAILESLVVLSSLWLAVRLPYTDMQMSGVFVLLVLHFLAFYLTRMYEDFPNRGYMIEFIVVARYSLFLLFATTFSSFMLVERFTVSRRGVFFFVLIHAASVYLFNLVLKHYIKRLYKRLAFQKQIYIITLTSYLPKIFQQLDQIPMWDGHIAAVTVLDTDQKVESPYFMVDRQNMFRFATQSVVDEVFIYLPDNEYNIAEYINYFESMGIAVSVHIHALDYLTSSQRRVQQLAGFSVVTYSTNFYKFSHVLMKRALDIIGAVVGLILCGIAAIFLVPKIKADGGSAIFTQKRVGKNGRIFNFYKFRSMRMDAEQIKKELMAQNEMSGLMFKMEDDPRITPIGKFIRRTSLDELPQFFNVLRGDMSLVGTRPPTLDEYEQYTPEQKRRLSFKPGITGLWQVSGRSDITDFDDIVALDLEYIDNWTIWSDIKILFKTVQVVLLGDGAK